MNFLLPEELDNRHDDECVPLGKCNACHETTCTCWDCSCYYDSGAIGDICEWCDLDTLDCLNAQTCCPDCTHIWTRWAEQSLTGQGA